MNFINIIKEIVKNDKFMSFIIGGASSCLIYISNKKVIFETVSKTVYTGLVGFITKNLLERGTEKATSIINMDELKNVIGSIVKSTNPGIDNIGIKEALEGLKKSQNLPKISENINSIEVVNTTKEIIKNVTQEDLSYMSIPYISSFSLFAVKGVYYTAKALNPRFKEKMEGLSKIYNESINSEELSKYNIFMQVYSSSIKALGSLGLYEWSILVGILGIGVITYYVVMKGFIYLRNKKLEEIKEISE